MNVSSAPATLEKVGFVGLIRIDNPPVNVLSHLVRCELAAAIARAKNDPEIKILLLASAGELFSAGMDLKEFNRLPEEPSLQQLQDQLESAPIPVVAVIQGLALGGGLELAMACHYRLAQKNARLGLPEITLGIIPGAGGTQRLPRLIGARAALDMVLAGTPVVAADAKANGLLDEVVESDLREAALKFCQRLVHEGLGPRPTCSRAVVPGLSESDTAEVLAAHARTLKGLTTQNLVVEAVRAAVLPFSEGMAIEATLAQKSLASGESRALRHLFFAERETAKAKVIPKIDTAAEPGRGQELEINRVAVIGAGTMGTGIAVAFADAGLEVTVIDNAKAALTRSWAIIDSIYESNIKRGRITRDIADQRMRRISMSEELRDAAAADIAIEAVFEETDLKREVLSVLDSIVSRGSVIASNTSTLSVTELAHATAHPNRVLGLHFFVPAHASRLLEIVPTDYTSTETLAAAFRIAKLLKKVPVLTRDAFGFIGNRMMLDGYFREAEQLLLEGATPTQVDTALEEFGFAMGPQRVSDLAGNDIGTKARIQLRKRENRPDPYFVIADRLTELGRLGQKTGRGFYCYQEGSREALPDPEVISVIERLAAARGVRRREIDGKEIVERCVLALINIGAEVLQEGIAACAADIDVVWTSGYGFPRHLGGPMFYADTLGLGQVGERINYYYKKFGHYWRPTELIGRLAAKGEGFEQYKPEASR